MIPTAAPTSIAVPIADAATSTVREGFKKCSFVKRQKVAASLTRLPQKSEKREKRKARTDRQKQAARHGKVMAVGGEA